MTNTAYTEAEHHMIRRMFNRGAADGTIADALRLSTGRDCGAEAIRKQRQALGLKKVPTYERWSWAPEGQQYASLSAAAWVRPSNLPKLDRVVSTVDVRAA